MSGETVMLTVQVEPGRGASLLPCSYFRSSILAAEPVDSERTTESFLSHNPPLFLSLEFLFLTALLHRPFWSLCL